MLSTLVGFVLATQHVPPVICVDPGHPSEIGTGTRGSKLTEMAVCWSVAKELKVVLGRRGYRVVLTKTSERSRVTNRKRAEIANENGAALMLRLHCDAGKGSGLATYYPDRSGKINGRTGPSKEICARSKVAALKFHEATVKALRGQLPGRNVLTDRQTAVGSRYGALIGSIYSEVPTVLVEMCKLQNPKDEQFFLDQTGYRKMADALAAGVWAAVPIVKG